MCKVTEIKFNVNNNINLMNTTQNIIEQAFEQILHLQPNNVSQEIKQAVANVLDKLNTGTYRIAEKINNNWIVNQWLKKAILLAFRLYESKVFDAGFCQFFDKIPLKFTNYTINDFHDAGTRVIPSAIIRYGAFIGANTVIMPAYINIGAYVDTATMIDTWSTIGSCAQIGKNVHISGGVGIGGILEPLQAQPTIIEDNCFIGARSEIVEGVIIEENSVLAMGVYLSQSTKIYNRLTKTITYGKIPAGSVVVPGNLPSSDGSHSLYCAVIVKHIDAKTKSKTSINELLRNI